MKVLLEVDTSAGTKKVRTVGWTCERAECGVFNGEEKERLERCRACEGKRPACEVTCGSAFQHTCIMISEVA